MKERLANQKVAVSIVFVLAMFMSIMDITIVNVALPKLGHDLHATETGVAAVSISYLVALAVVIPASGWLGDKFGGKRILLFAIVLFTLGSVLCGVAQTFGELVGFRVLQGVGGGMLTPVGMAMLFRAFPPAERVRASSILVIPTALAPAIGPVLGGVLVDDLSWRWVFFVNLPFGILALIFGSLYLKPEEPVNAGRFDVLGFALSGIGFGLLMYGVSEGPQNGWSNAVNLTSIVIGVVLISALIVTQLRTTEPLLNLRVFADRLFRSATITLFLAMAAFLGVLYLVALFFQDGLGLSALGSGLSTFPEALGVMAGAQSASRFLYPRFGPRRLMSVGLLVVAVGMALMALVNSQADLWPVRILMFFLGFAIAHNFVPTQAAAFARISPAETSRASTVFNAIRQLGGAVGVAILTTAITTVGATKNAPVLSTLPIGTRIPTVPNLHAYHVAFLVAAALAVVAAASALTIRDSDADSTRVGHAAKPVEREPALVES